jgi:hypothetical protein
MHVEISLEHVLEGRMREVKVTLQLLPSLNTSPEDRHMFIRRCDNLQFRKRFRTFIITISPVKTTIFILLLFQQHVLA